MKKLFFLILLSLISIFATAQTTRPKVAVVLSGGGAKGVAHVRALKVIEEAGIPIDMIVGTSMGSLVGGLYASGYTTSQLDSIVTSMNWMELLTDKVDRSMRSLDMKQKTENYIIHAEFDKSPFEVLEGGFLKGNSVSYLLSELTADHLTPMEYDELPIPFACIATDITKNKEIVMRRGILAESLRSSMAIPGVFPPVKLDSMVLVDGGLKNNFPVDVAREMGADYVIGVSVASEGKHYEELNSTVDVLMQVLDLVCTNKVNDNISQSDVFMHVDVNGYSSASFTSQAVDTLLVHGENAARDKWDELVELRRKLEKHGPLHIAERRPKTVEVDHDTFSPPSTIYSKTEKDSFIGIGARFDNEELASILLGGKYEFNHKSNFHLGVEARLGKRIDTRVYMGVSLGHRWNADVQYRFTHNDMRLYNEGEHIANFVYNKNRILIDFSRSSKKLKLNMGAQFSYTQYPELLTADTWANLNQLKKNERSLFYFFKLEFDNMDSRLLPKKGMKWSVKYDYVTDNGYSFNGSEGVNIVEGFWHVAIPLSNSTYLNPYVEGRFIQNNNTYLSHCNFIGGLNSYGHYITQQVSFAGINYVQVAPNSLLVGGVNLRQHLTENNYLFFQGNYAIAGSSIDRFVSQKHLIGTALGYGYKSPIGPLEFNFNWSNVTKKLGVYLNIGYLF